MTNNKLLSKAREARRAKAASRCSSESKHDDSSNTTPGETPHLVSKSSFVRPSPSNNSNYSEGKTVMTFDELKASGALTPVKQKQPPPRRTGAGSSRPSSASGSTTSRSSPAKAGGYSSSSSRPKSSPAVVGSASLRSRIGKEILKGSSTSDGDTTAAAAAAAAAAPPPFASPVTGRTQKAAAKLAARRTASSTKNKPETSSKSLPDEELVPSTSASSNLAGAFDEEKDVVANQDIIAPRKSKSKEATTKATTSSSMAKSFASPPLSSTTSTLSRQRKQSSSSSTNKSRRSVGRSSITVDSSAITPEVGGKGEGRTPLKQLPLSVQREKERQREARMMAASKSDTDPNVESRRNLDKRTARLRYSGDFMADLAKHQPPLLSPSPATTTRPAATASTAAALDGYEKNGVSIYVRKRPIFKYELDRGEFDVVAVDKSASQEQRQQQDGDTVIISNCVMHPDMRRKLVKPSYFPCTKAFDEHCTQDDIYENIARPMVQNSARGGVSTILMFGQTGSGKTHTMTGIEERAAQGIFDEVAACGNDAEAVVIEVQFVELSGKSCKDLLGKAGDEVTLLEGKDGSVKLLNAESIEVKSPQELAKTISLGKGRRATEATDVNGVSSRSHAVCQIQITFKGRKRRNGLLNLLDLAGSERKNDSMYHSSVRQKESTEINASLWALKECTRTRALAASSSKNKNGNVVIPYRSSNLTRLLRESFERDSARLCVIATVAPNATDTEHSMETLRFVSQLVGLEKSAREGDCRFVEEQSMKMKKTEALPKTYTHEQLCQFLKRKKIKGTVPEKIDGKAIMKMSSQQIRMLFGGDAKYAGMAADVFNALRKENDRVSKQQRAERINLAKARKEGAYGQ